MEGEVEGRLGKVTRGGREVRYERRDGKGC